MLTIYGKLFNFFSLPQCEKTKICLCNRLLIFNEYIPEQKIPLCFRGAFAPGELVCGFLTMMNPEASLGKVT